MPSVGISGGTRRWQAAVVLAAGLAAAAPAGASVWGGINGTVRLLLADGDTLAPALVIVPGPEGVIIEVQAVLDGVDRVFYQGQQVRALGGFELQLVVEGAEAAIAPLPTGGSDPLGLRRFNMADLPGQCWVGLYPELPLPEGRAVLMRWRVHLPGQPREVVLRLDPQGLYSCAQQPGCPESGAAAIWAGSAGSNMAGLLFGAGGAPAYLNWEQPPAAAQEPAPPTWLQTGLFTPPPD